MGAHLTQFLCRKPLQTGCRGHSFFAGCGIGRLSRPDSTLFCPGEWIFLAQEVEHRAANPVPGVCSEFEPAGWLETVHRLNQADCAGADEIVKGDAGWHLGPQPLRQRMYMCEVLNDARLSSCSGLGLTISESR